MKKKRQKNDVFQICAFLLTVFFLFEKTLPASSLDSKPESQGAETQSDEKDRYIRWVDFSVSVLALKDALKYDIETYGTPSHLGFVPLLSRYACRNGGDFSGYKSGALQQWIATFEKNADGSISLPEAPNEKIFAYYLEAYDAVLGGMVGEYTKITVDEAGNEVRQTGYGLRVCSPIASGYSYQHYDDFGAERSYGYKRHHLGHDIVGSIGTPIVAVEGGYVEALGWNRYGGWRIGIRSFDGKRYYYYAHLRRGHPYADLYEGKIIRAGDVIGYLGKTGYSTAEDTDNISIPHLHFGLELIFDPSQKDGWNQIWIDLYALTDFLKQNRVETFYDSERDERRSKTYYLYPESPEE